MSAVSHTVAEEENENKNHEHPNRTSLHRHHPVPIAGTVSRIRNQQRKPRSMKQIPYELRDLIPIPNWITWLAAIVAIGPAAYLFATVVFNLRDLLTP